MTFWDVLLLVLALALVVEGLMKGAVRLGFGLAGLVAGFLYAGYLADRAAGYLTFLVEHLRRPVALAAGFFLIFTVFVLVGAIVHSVVKKSGLGCVNRVLGAVLGLVAALYVAGGLVHIAGRLSPDFAAKVTAGPVVRLMAEWALGMESLIPPLPPHLPATQPPEMPKAPGKPSAATPAPKGDAP
jgi:hypothetical protein